MTSANQVPPEFLALLIEPVRTRLQRSPRLMALLGEALARAEATSPSVPTHLLCYLAERFPGNENLEDALLAWCTEDLRLCHDCLEGDAAALASFESQFRPVIRRTLVRLRLAEPLREEQEQQLLVTLLVGEAGRPALIGSYLGLGKLAHWLRVVVARHGRRALGREKQMPLLDSELASRVIDPRTSAELAGAKQVYRRVFEEAFRQAMAALQPREATLLRQRYADALTLQQIGAVYRVHHETARRWLQEIHRQVLSSTRKQMASRLEIPESELDTIMNMVRSSLDLTFHTFFAREPRGETH